ncbi:MAG: VTT domain-containing protein [Gemmataceae bacterium]
MAELFQQILDVFRNLLDTPALMATLGKPEMTVAAFVALNLIVFTETGLLIGFFLPGDSLLVTAGLVAFSTGWSLPLLIGTLCVSAIVGDSVGYAIGFRTGPRIFRREKSFFFRRDHLMAAEAFYERHGGKTIVLARFMPIIRTFAPVVAGVGRMDYRRFVTFNVVGGISWVSSMILLGYALPKLIDPLFKHMLGDQFEIRNHIEKVIIVVVALSISPGILAWLRSRLGPPKPPSPHDSSLQAV